ncbi:HNH endonuclease [Patescibacteria group bacterium]|nr:HNH endonuclease [Patescibacteria group bacterium]
MMPRPRGNRKGIPVKNGMYIDRHSHGRTSYRKILHHGHPRTRKGYVYQHILVWEKAHGKMLPKDWIIHHLNGEGLDNRPENLVAMPRKEHSSWTILLAARKRIKTLEAAITNLQQLRLLS